MPFRDDYKDRYELGIKPACIAAGATCERVDEQIFLQNILERIYGQISKADIIVADMTGRNANVFYEVGYAHGLAKPVVLLTESADDIPFDLKHYPHVVFGKSIATLKEQLAKRIRRLVEHPSERTSIAAVRSDKLSPEQERMAQHISNYLNANGFRMVSFQKVRDGINGNYTDEAILELIEKSPERFRRTKVSGKGPGIGFAGR
jgi:hypothetical protein